MSTRRQQLVDALRAEFGDKLVSSTMAYEEVTVEVAADDLLEVATALRDNDSFQFSSWSISVVSTTRSMAVPSGKPKTPVVPVSAAVWTTCPPWAGYSLVMNWNR